LAVFVSQHFKQQFFFPLLGRYIAQRFCSMNKVLNIILVLILSFSVNANENLFSGTWELVSGEYIDHEGNLVSYEELNLSSIKVINETHFSFVTMSGDKFWSSGAGTFKFTNNEYIESPIYTSFNSQKGKKYVFKYRKDGEKWFSSRWENEKRVEYEVWQRVSE
jgi:hypothetical protein